jgi:hypothetical protein
MLQQEFNTLGQAIGQQLRSILKIVSQGTLLRLHLEIGEKQRDQGHAQNQRNDQAKADSHRELTTALSPPHVDMGVRLLRRYNGSSAPGRAFVRNSVCSRSRAISLAPKPSAIATASTTPSKRKREGDDNLLAADPQFIDGGGHRQRHYEEAGQPGEQSGLRHLGVDGLDQYAAALKPAHQRSPDQHQDGRQQMGR